MSRAREAVLLYDAITIEGGLLPAEWLAKVANLAAPQQTPADYGVPKGLALRDELGRYWRIAQAHWQDFMAARGPNGDSAAASTRLLAGLLRDVFGAADFVSASAPRNIAEHSYPITGSACGSRLPLVVAPHDLTLDQRDHRFGDGGRQRSAFGLLQDYLNVEDAALWGLVSNGLQLRLARDNASLTRPAWVAADLERIFTEDRFADFSLLWLLIHASRFGRADQLPQTCSLEAWRDGSREQGTRAREHLRQGVEAALLALGQGFLVEPANAALRARLASGALTRQDYFRQLLRLVYRLIFLLTIEERGLLHPVAADPAAIKLYQQGYGLKRLRDRASRRRGWDRQRDLWLGLKPVFTGLAVGQPLLALPALGGLFASGECADLAPGQLGNAALQTAMFYLGWMTAGGVLTRVNWCDMGPEELGSIYESLLELVPDIGNDNRSFTFAVGDQTRGNARKTSGSYYTPDSLVQELLDSALDPVITQRTAGATNPAQALLSITVCDPACGSGHFLLAAARRLATRLAQLRAQGTPSGEDYRHALRDVVAHCIYGVDVNPMALELARMSLWLEAMTPDRPLGFLDHHLQCGDALLGVLDLSILDQGIPDDAFKALTGDDTATTSELKKANKIERTSWQRTLATGDLFRTEQLAATTDAVESLADDDLDAIAAKRAAWQTAALAARDSRLARLADLYVGTFLLPKTLGAVVPSSRHLWAVANMQTAAGLAEVEAAARVACREASVFHWWLKFPHIHAGGGFAVMLGNPPWEMLALDPQEFFAAEAPEIANAPHMAARNRLITKLESQRPQLFGRYMDAVRRMEAVQEFAHASGRFPKAGFGRINLASLFAETFLRATGLDALGRTGVVLPSGISTDSFTQHLFNAIVGGGWLVSLLDFENSDGVFPGVHRSYKFCLLTLGRSGAARFTCFATQVAQLADARRQFTLTSEDFALINPNTRTCPVFRSERDAELTKAIYRRVPVLIREDVKDSCDNVLEPEINSWGVRFQLMFMMNTDSGLFRNEAGIDTLPLYEAKMIHQFDHRWATYVPKSDGDGVETIDCTDTQKANHDFVVGPRYWVKTQEALARLARVPGDVRKGWLVVHKAVNAAQSADALKTLWLALAQWIAGEYFRREAGEPTGTGYSNARKMRAAPRVEVCLVAEFPACARALREAKVTGPKAVTEFAKWAARDFATPLGDDELSTLRRFATQTDFEVRDTALVSEIDTWMDRRSPRWLMGWRDVTNTTNERTVIASVTPRVGVGNNLPLMLFDAVIDRPRVAALLGNLGSLALDFVARQKVGGMHLNYFIYKQLPVIPPDHYTDVDLAFIVPRVLELTYTAHDLADWARDLGYTGAPFAWNTHRRAQLRAELDACYARLYGLSRDELRYILDPADVMGHDYPSETFRGLKKNEERDFGEYRTQRLVLEAWDALAEQTIGVPVPVVVPVKMPPPVPRRKVPFPSYTPARAPCCEAEDWLAGLVCDVLLQYRTASEATLRLLLTSPTPANAVYGEELSAWTTPERMDRLPAILAWFRDLSLVPRSGDMQMTSGDDLHIILGDDRTRALASLLIEAHAVHEAELARSIKTDTGGSSADAAGDDASGRAVAGTEHD